MDGNRLTASDYEQIDKYIAAEKANNKHFAAAMDEIFYTAVYGAVGHGMTYTEATRFAVDVMNKGMNTEECK